MTFTLVVEIDSNVTHHDVALCLRRAAALIDRKPNIHFEHGDGQPIRDQDDREEIGNWTIEE